MNVKKCGIFAAIALAVLIPALLVTGCFEPVGKLVLPQRPVVELEPGMGALWISLGDNSNGRTIMPTEIADLTDFDSFTITIEVEDTPGTWVIYDNWEDETIEIDNTSGEADDPISLPEGDYRITIKAFIDGTPDILVARGVAEVTIVAGITAEEDIALIVITDGLGKGTFSWTILFPSNVDDDLTDTATIEIFDSTGTLLEPNALDYEYEDDLFIDDDSSVELDSGYYTVVVTFTKPKFRSIMITSALHIYQGMESIWTPPRPADLVQNRFDVSYFLNDGTGNLFDGAPVEVDFGRIATAPAPTRQDYILNGWWTENGTPTWGTEWLFGAAAGTRVTADLDLYARWEEDAGTLEITLTFDLPGDRAAEFRVTSLPVGYTITLDELEDDGDDIVLTIVEDNGPVVGWTATSWSFMNKVNTPVTRTGTELTLDFADIGQPQVYVITVTVTIDGVPYSQDIDVTVTY
ncbi:MAG: InlB B-repeat-containing protein [Treponema sp.]|jgi:hypothetical protein|nr:InlB B-repeat-containing protein [Treponema sp.]